LPPLRAPDLARIKLYAWPRFPALLTLGVVCGVYARIVSASGFNSLRTLARSFFPFGQ
jgi:hypothetical protein